VEIVKADFSVKAHCDDYVRLLNDYALSVMGGGIALKSGVLDSLASEIAQREFITVFLAYINEDAVALMTCMEGFSTFKCRPLMNIHDIYVANDFRGKGIATQLLNSAEQLAKQKKCCKLTLEVLEGNTIAKMAYQKFGFAGYELNPEIGSALFWEKSLD